MMRIEDPSVYGVSGLALLGSGTVYGLVAGALIVSQARRQVAQGRLVKNLDLAGEALRTRGRGSRSTLGGTGGRLGVADAVDPGGQRGRQNLPSLRRITDEPMDTPTDTPAVSILRRQWMLRRQSDIASALVLGGCDVVDGRRRVVIQRHRSNSSATMWEVPRLSGSSARRSELCGV